MVKDILENNREEIIAMYNNGDSTCKIGKHFKISNASVYIFLRDICNIPIRQVKTLGDYSDKIIELYNLGYSCYKIGKELDLGSSTCQRYCKELGLSFSDNSKNREIPLRDIKEQIIADYQSGQGCTVLSQKYKCGETSITDLLKENGVEIRGKRHHFNEDYFEEIDSKMKAYFLGFLYADGYNSGDSIILSITDKEPVVKLMQEVDYKEDYVAVPRRKEWYKDQYKIALNSRKMCMDLDRLGCHRAKTFSTKFPTDEQVPQEFKKYFILGLIDGDGCLTTSNNLWYLSMVGTIELLTGISNFFNNNLNIKGSLFIDKTNHNKNIRCLTIGGRNQFKTVCDYLYKDVEFCLERKRNKYLEFLKTV